MRRAFLLIALLFCCAYTFGQGRARSRAPRSAASAISSRNQQTGYTISPASGGFCPGGSVTLTGTPAASGRNYQWTYNNANINNANSISYAARQAGSYSLLAYNSTDTIFYDTVSVIAYSDPVAAFTANPSGQCSNTPVTFSNSSSGAATYLWSFGDPNSATNTSTADNPTHTFIGTPGNTTQNFTVQLISISVNGCRDTLERIVTTMQIPSAKLGGTGSATYNGLPYFKVCANAASNFNFTNQSTTTASNSNYRIEWGDNSPDFTATSFSSTSHSYAVGNYVLKLSVTGSNGCVAVAQYNVFVGNNPAVAIGNPGNTSICTGSMLTFPVTGTGSNAPGTVYKITINDTPTVYTYIHPDVPNPFSQSHLFTKSSCNTNSSDGATTYNNSFSINIVASNPCGQSAGSVVPIYVSQKPKAVFSVSPKDTVCVNTLVTFNSTGTANTYVDNGQCSAGNSVWVISPATGWSISSGSIGNDFGLGATDVSAWTPGSNTIGINFTVPGTYTVKLVTGNVNCGIDSFVKTICVNPKPTADFLVDQNIGCAPLTVGTTSISNTPICGSNSYTWSISYSSTTGCTPSTDGSSFSGGTNTSSINPQLQFANPGTYTISLVVKNSANSCSSPTATKAITVKGKPVASINILSPICESGTINPTISATCNVSSVTHSWGFPGGSPSSSASTSPGSITYSAAGAYTVYDTVTNECGATPVSRTLTVNETPVFSVPTNLSVCPASVVGPFTFTSSVSSTTFTWTNNNTLIGLAASGSSNPITFTATNTGTTPITGTITVKGTKGSCVTNKTFQVTVYNKPALPTAPSPITYCQGATAVPLTATAGASGTLYWYDNANNPLPAAPMPSTATAGNTIYKVSQKNDTTGCESGTTPITVTVYPSITALVATPTNPTSCGGNDGSIRISGLANTTSYSVSYTRNGGAPIVATSTSTGAGTITITALSSATYDNIFVTFNSCPSNIVGPITLSDPNPPATPVASVAASPICSGSTISLSATSTTSGVTFTWSGPNSYSATGATATITNATVAASGTYSVTASLAGCSSAAGTVSVTVNQKPATPTASAPAVCAGQTLNLTASSSTAGVSWNWSGPNAFSDNTQSPSIPGATTAMSGSYTVTATLGSCSSTATVTANVKPTPVITATPNNPTSCGGNNGTIVISGLSSGSYTVNYLKNGSAQVLNNQTATSGGTITITGLTAATYSDISVSLNACPSNAVGPFTLSDPNPPATPTATANGPVCSGSPINLQASGAAAGASWSWSGPNAFNSTQQNPVINSSVIGNTGTYSVTVSVNGCSSAAGTVDVTVNQTPAQPTINSNAPLCSGATLNLSAATTTAGVMTWGWTGPNAFTSTQQALAFTNAGTSLSGSYTVIATLGSCSSLARSITVLVKPTPNITGTIASNSTSCNSATGSITLQGLDASTSYTVNFTKNGVANTRTANSNASGDLVISGLSAATYDAISVTLSACASNIVGPFTLTDPNPPATPAAANGGAVCTGSTITLTASSVTSGVSYSWTGPNNFSSVLQNPNVANASMAAAGTYTVVATLSGCTSAPATTSVMVNQTPATPVAVSPDACSGSTLLLSATSATSGVSWSWSGPGNFSSTLQNPGIPNASSANGGSYTVTATLGACTSSSSTVAVIKPRPAITGAASNPASCNTATGSISIQGLQAGTYSVNYTTNGTPQTLSNQVFASGAITISNLAAGLYDHITVTLNGCVSNEVGPFTLSDPNPPATPTAGNSGPVCSGTNLTLNASSPTTGVTYSWSGPSGFTSAQAAPVITNIPMTAAGTYSVTATLNGCTSAAGSTTVVVNQTPAVPTASSPDACSGSTLSLTAANTTPGVSYAWSGPNAFSSALQNPVINSVTGAAAGTYSVTTTLGSCSTSNTTVALIKSTPAISGSFTNPTNCNTATGFIAISGLTPGTYTVNYMANGNPQVLTGQVPNGSGVITINSLASGSYTNISVTLNGCASNVIGPFTLVDPNPPAAPTVSVNAPICADNTLALSASGPAGASYSWSGPAAFGSTLANPTIPNAQVINSGTYSVRVTLNNCTSPAATINAVVNGRPPLPAAATPLEYCKNVTAPALSATALAGNVLNWYTTATGGTASPTPPVPQTTTPGNTIHYVSQTTAAGCEGGRTAISVVVRQDADAHFTYIRDTACWPFVLPVTNTSFAANNGSYTWYADGVSIGTGATFPGYSLPTPSTAVSIKLLAASAYGCKPDSMQHTFRTLPKPVAAFTASVTTGCGPLNVTFTNTTALIDTFRYSWDFGNGQFASTQQPGTIVFDAAPTANDTIYVVKLRAFNACDTSIFTVNITVSSKPKVLFTPDRTIGCSPMRVLFTNHSQGFGNSYTWNFDDGTIVNTALRDTISHVFNSGLRDTFYVKLRAVNACGTDSATYSIVVLPNPIQLFMAVNGTDQNGCAPHTVRFINNSSGATGFQWNFGDGNLLSTVRNIDTVVHNYAAPGTYTVLLKGFNGCTDTTMSVRINVYPKPLAAFTISRYTACLGDTLRFTNHSDSASAYLWQFGDGGTSTFTDPTHVYNTAGNYFVVLHAFRLNPTGSFCSDSVRVPVQILSGQPGSFSVSDSVASCVPFTVTFSNTSGPVATTTWAYGDGSTGSGSPASHTYTAAGTYVAQLSSVSPGGCTYTAQKTIRVNAPAGVFTYTGGFVCGGRFVRFDATVSGTDTLVWNFGDGSSQSTVQPFVYHSYANPGIYVPSVALVSAGGCRLLLAGPDTIRVDRIINGFTQSPARSCGSTLVNFTDTAHVYFGRQQVSWDFGDGGTGTGSPVAHRYTNTGTYLVRQIVISNSGCSDTLYRSINVSVNAQPAASIGANTLACTSVPETLTANVLSVDPITMYQWTVNGVIVSNSNPYVTNFAAAGNYSIRLVAGTSNGCFDTAYHNINVRLSPTVNATPPGDLCLGSATPLSASGNGIVQWSWSPVQGLTCISCPNPVATPTATTPYIVTGINAAGCAGYDTVVITVHGPFAMTISADDSICVGASVNLLASGAQQYLWSPNQDISSITVPNPTVSPRVTTRYMVVGRDGFNCYNDTAYVTVAVGQYPIVNLGADLVLATGTRFPLNSTVTNGPISTWLWSPAADLSCANCPLPVALVRNDVTYTVTVTTPYGCSDTDSLTIKAFCREAQVFLPNAFSPDGDGVNDVFMVQSSGITTVKTFRIFNRWGTLVFEKNQVTPNDQRFGWDGRVNGVAAAPDVYVYTVEVLCENGTPYTYKGNVTILK
jgi:gliding motility-associated-like protein